MKVGRRACSGALAVLALASACDGAISLGSSGADAPGSSIDGSMLGSSGGAASGGASGSSSGGAPSSSSSGSSGSSSGVASGSSSGGGAASDAGTFDATVLADSGSDSGPDACSSGACDVPAPSCRAGGPGMTDCGVNRESCCISLDVPGGTFFRTYRNTGTGPTNEADPATVSDFRLDKYDVTVGRFRQFVSAVLPPDGGPGWLPPEGSGKHTNLNGGQGLLAVGVPEAGTQFELGWNGPLYNSSVAPTDSNLSGGTWTPSVGASEDLPITRVNWYEAYAFCIWDGGFLPSRAEWEYAAAGGIEQREYPWGSADPGTAGQYAIYDYSTDCQLDGGGACFDAAPGLGLVAPVGTAPAGAGRWGQLDLGGNANQWLLDWYGPAFVVPCVDCADLSVGPASGGIYRGYAGGGADEPASHMMTWLGYSGFGPDYRYVAGLRCARPPEGGAPDASTPPDAGAPTAPSCQAGGDGLTNCGANSESCCTSLVVEGGTFYRSYDLTGLGGLTLAADGGPTAEGDPATISTFRLDKYEVTVGRFRQFVNAWDGGSGLDGGPGYIPPAGSGKHTHLNGGSGLNATGALGGDAGYAGYEPGWATSDNVYVAPTDVDLDCVGNCTYGVNALDGVGQPIGTWNYFATWTPSPGNTETLPIDSVNWYEAYAFCIWDGGFLPSEAEWEYAAAGGSDQREYPWGAPATGNGDSRYAIYAGDYGDGGPLTHIAPVGTAALGAGRWGQLDLLGNVFEWTLDYYPRGGAYFDPCTDCSDFTATPTRAFHGGDFDSLISVGIPSYRLSENPEDRPWTEGAWPTGTPTTPIAGSTVGFRCARTP